MLRRECETWTNRTFRRRFEGGVKATLLIKEMLLKEPELDWTYLKPSHMLVPGERTGQFRLGLDDLLVGRMVRAGFRWKITRSR